MRKIISALFLLALALSLAPTGSGQAGQQAPPPAPSPEEEFKLRLRVDLVATPLVVYDRRGEFLYDLRREEITVLDNGVPQQIGNFELASGPVSLVLVVNTSRNLTGLLEQVRSSAVLFPSYVLGEAGEGAVVTFDDDVTLHQDFTSDMDAFIRAVDRIPVGDSGNRLADALDLAVAKLQERPEGRRRVVIIVSEAKNSGSTVRTAVPLRYAQIHNVSVYTIHLTELQSSLRSRPEDSPSPRSTFPPGVMATPPTPGSVQTPNTETQRMSERANLGNLIELVVRGVYDSVGDNVLQLYSQGTGALHYSPSTRTGLEDALNQIGQDLHNQYLLSYRPSNRDETGFHRIQVNISRPGVRVRARPGYYVGIPPS
ncbi:MAG: VWA domain-containing protein [Candidatus Acidiferrales bacterium]